MSQISRALAATGLALLASGAPYPTASAAADAKPYKIVNTAQEMGTGGIDYVYADSDGRRLYVPRGASVRVFDLDTLKPAGSISGLKGGHGVAVDPKSHRGFSSSNPVLMWDTKTLETVKSIQVEGRPDGILFEPLTERIYVLSHAAPNVTVLDGKDGSIVGTIDLGGAPEQAASDGEGHVYVDLEDKDSIAVVDAKEMKMTGKYDIAGKGGGPGGLGLDAKNHILFAFCHSPQNCVVLSATDGKIITTLPIGRGTDGGGFNPNTMEAFSSQGDGTLTIIKETSPTTFEVEQTVQTKARAKTCTLDTKTDQIVLITTERPPAPAAAPAAGEAPTTPSPAAANPPAGGGDRPAGDRPGGDRPGGGGGGGGGGQRGGGGGRNNGPAMLDILVVGR